MAIGGGALWFVALFAAFYLLIYVPVMLAEAETMRQLFATDYEDYSKQVPLFAPRLTAYRGSRLKSYSQFDVSLYLRHREYRAALGFVAVYAMLAAKLALMLG